jgi:hypothetical protein
LPNTTYDLPANDLLLTDSQLGIRTATITYIDTVDNESASATASLQEAQRGFVINGESTGDFSGISVALKPTPPNTTLIDLISVSVVFAISASKATPTAISERVNSAAVT